MIQVNNSSFHLCLHPTCLYTHPRKWPILVQAFPILFFRLTSFSNDFHCLSHELACTLMLHFIFTLLVCKFLLLFVCPPRFYLPCCSSFLVLIYQYASATNIYNSLIYLNKYKVHHRVLRSPLWLTAYMKSFALFHAYFKHTATGLVRSH
jgi:hypothetical protein